MWTLSELKRILMRKAKGLDTADLGAVMWPVHYPAVGGSGATFVVPKDPHVTVVVFKDIHNPGLGFTREDVIDAVRQTQWDAYLHLARPKLDWFGEDKDIPVLRVDHTYLYRYRDSVIEALAKRGIEVDMTFPDYKPHITIPEAAAESGNYPLVFMAGPVQVWWGNEKYNIE